MSRSLKTISPIDGSVFVERAYADQQAIDAAVRLARAAQEKWRSVSVEERAAYCEGFVDAMLAKREEIAREITWQMGRPIRYTPNELKGFEERARYMIGVAKDALADIRPESKSGFNRFITREPLGVVFTIAPWNYPFLTAVNSIVPAIMAGNAVILKHSSQTPLVAERFDEAFRAAGLPEGVFQYLHLHDDDATALVSRKEIDFVAFTGSVRVGHVVQQALSDKFAVAGLELGGKDPAYVRHDADLQHAVENLVDGSFFNSGQSCCGIERIYVHEKLYDAFVEGFVEVTKQYVLGDPMDRETTLGPLVKTAAADYVRQQIADAKAKGARALIDESLFSMSKEGTRYLAPQVMVDVNHSIELMIEENFGPVVGIMRVSSDEEAVRLMNDSPYGLTASIWTRDEEAAIALGRHVETGTLYMNRCDYLDPALAWTGVKDSGRGCTLSVVGYEHLTRPKSFHLRTSI